MHSSKPIFLPSSRQKRPRQGETQNPSSHSSSHDTHKRTKFLNKNRQNGLQNDSQEDNSSHTPLLKILEIIHNMCSLVLSSLQGPVAIEFFKVLFSGLLTICLNCVIPTLPKDISDQLESKHPIPLDRSQKESLLHMKLHHPIHGVTYPLNNFQLSQIRHFVDALTHYLNGSSESDTTSLPTKWISSCRRVFNHVFNLVQAPPASLIPLYNTLSSQKTSSGSISSSHVVSMLIASIQPHIGHFRFQLKSDNPEIISIFEFFTAKPHAS